MGVRQTLFFESYLLWWNLISQKPPFTTKSVYAQNILSVHNRWQHQCGMLRCAFSQKTLTSSMVSVKLLGACHKVLFPPLKSCKRCTCIFLYLQTCSTAISHCMHAFAALRVFWSVIPAKKERPCPRFVLAVCQESLGYLLDLTQVCWSRAPFFANTSSLWASKGDWLEWFKKNPAHN